MSELETALYYIRDQFLPCAKAEWNTVGFDWRDTVRPSKFGSCGRVNKEHLTGKVDAQVGGFTEVGRFS